MIRTSVWVKNTKVMPQYPAIYLFSWEREGILTSQTLYTANYKCAFWPSPSTQWFRQGINDAPQNCPKYVYFSREFPVTEGNKIQHIYFQFMTPARKLTHNTKFEHFWMGERHEFWEHHNYSSLWARESPKSDPERHKFWENALIDPSKNANK